MQKNWLRGLVLLVLLGLTRASHGVDAREPLTFQNMGLYGVWNEYFISKASPFDFLIIQAYAYEDRIEWRGKTPGGPTWNDWLHRARANGKRVIAVVCPAIVDDKGKLQTLASQQDEKEPLPVERFAAALDGFINQVDEQELYAITLAEENVFWNGQQERLNAVYEHAKKKKHNVPVYQWYTPSETTSIPGLNYPNLKADGWMADEYFAKRPLMDVAMRGYTVLQKPVFQIMWALGDYNIIPSAEKTFWGQYEVCRKYNIPVAFYFWVAPGEGPISQSTKWDPTVTPLLRNIFEDYCIHGAHLAKRLPAVPTSEWDIVPWEQKRIQLKSVAGHPSRVTYSESFEKPREVAAWKD